jgi:hypothetical protein
VGANEEVWQHAGTAAALGAVALKHLAREKQCGSCISVS